MAQQYDNEMRFVLFANDKGDNPKRPDRTGHIQVKGVKYKMSGWLKKDKNGGTFLAGTIEPAVVTGQRQTTQQRAAPEPAYDDDDSNVPF